jgi:heat shock protein HtpX
MNLSDLQAESSDWRGQLKKNRRKTRYVISMFLLIYLLVGLVVDVTLLLSQYPSLPIKESLQALITFQKAPYATLIMLIVAVVSLLITYAWYEKIMLLGTDSHEITGKNTESLKEQQLYHVVEEMKVAAGLGFMPKVYVIEADYMNAFATGFSEKSAMLAITRGLMEKCNRAELQAVMAHELSHIRHQDIRLTLTVAVLSNLTLIIIDLLFYNLLYGRGDKKEDNRLFMVILVLRYVLPLITVILTLFLSRTREYMADAGAVELMRDNDPMARVLLKINEDNEMHAEQYSKDYAQTAHEQIRQASYLYDPSNLGAMKSVFSLFSTHPSLVDRLAAIGFKQR